jgi:hypothetical protein
MTYVKAYIDTAIYFDLYYTVKLDRMLLNYSHSRNPRCAPA